MSIGFACPLATTRVVATASAFKGTTTLFNTVNRRPRQCRRVRFINRCHSIQSSSEPITHPASSETEQGIRINKCFKSFASRRESDGFIKGGRVRINGEVAVQGARVFSGDVVLLDDKIVEWERLTLDVGIDRFTYLKHWKDIDIVSTTNEDIPNNIIAQIPQEIRGRDRVFPVGRLDENSTGLILLTSDGRLPNAVLGAGKQCPKEYIATPDMFVQDNHMKQLREGVDITTVAQRDRGIRKSLTAPTLPCEVERVGEGMQLMFRLKEGRNRQIRKMLGVLGYTTRSLHRVGMMGITLEGLSGPGDVQVLNELEMKIVKEKLEAAEGS